MSDVNAVPETEVVPATAVVEPAPEAPNVVAQSAVEAEMNETAQSGAPTSADTPSTGADVKAALLHVLDGFNNYSLAVGFQRIADLLAQ